MSLFSNSVQSDEYHLLDILSNFLVSDYISKIGSAGGGSEAGGRVIRRGDACCAVSTVLLCFVTCC